MSGILKKVGCRRVGASRITSIIYIYIYKQQWACTKHIQGSMFLYHLKAEYSQITTLKLAKIRVESPSKTKHECRMLISYDKRWQFSTLLSRHDLKTPQN